MHPYFSGSAGSSIRRGVRVRGIRQRTFCWQVIILSMMLVLLLDSIRTVRLDPKFCFFGLLGENRKSWYARASSHSVRGCTLLHGTYIYWGNLDQGVMYQTCCFWCLRLLFLVVHYVCGRPPYVQCWKRHFKCLSPNNGLTSILDRIQVDCSQSIMLHELSLSWIVPNQDRDMRRETCRLSYIISSTGNYRRYRVRQPRH